MSIENIIVGLVLLACVAYIVRHLWKLFTAPSCNCTTGCDSCPLAENCKKVENLE